MYHFIDYVSKKSVNPQGLIFTGDKNPWEVIMDLSIIKEQLNFNDFKKIKPNFKKYLPFLPINKDFLFNPLENLLTMLIKSKSLSQNLNLDLMFKLENQNLTRSFKDRGSMVEIAIAKEFKANAIILASTGNMAASCACFAALAKIPCFILVPETIPMTKLAQAIIYGGKIIKIKGDYNDAANLAKSLAKTLNFYLAGDYAFRVEGQKTAAFELIEQLNYEVPDMIIVPMGCGTNISAYAKGFAEFYALGLIHKMPQLIGVEASGANVIVSCFEQKKRFCEGLTTAHTIASAIAVPNPIDSIKALDALYATDGFALSVSDQEILKAQSLLAKEEGLFVEISSAVSIAALLKILETMDLKNKKIVCVLTGDGLKDANVMLKALPELTSISPNEEEFMKLYRENR